MSGAITSDPLMPLKINGIWTEVTEHFGDTRDVHGWQADIETRLAVLHICECAIKIFFYFKINMRFLTKNTADIQNF